MADLKIFNGTPHPLNIFSPEDTYSDGRKLYVKEEAVPVVQVPSQGTLNATKENAELPSQFEGSDLPLRGAVIFTDADPLPSGYDIYVASQLYRSALVQLGRDTTRIATICDAVYSSPENPRPCGCLSLAVG